MVTDNVSQTDDTTAFLRAARSGNLEKVVEYLDTSLDINTANSNGLNALHLASKDGHVEIVTELLKRGAKVDAATKKGNTALHIASLAGQDEIVNILIQYGAAVNIQSQNGFTPLYMAAQENHDQVVKLLLSNGANQSLATEDGFTPLAVAMQQGHDKVVSVLLENDSKGKVRLPALHIAAKKDDCKAADLLLQNDHKPDVTSKSGFTPLHIAAHYGNEEIGRLLIKRGADVNYLAKHNISPLHVAAKWGKNNMVKQLLENSAMIDAKTRDGLTPLHCAARSGHEEVVSTLLEHSAPISARTKNGLAPLHMASQGDHVEAARVLLYHRAPVDEVTIDYLTSLHVAAHCGHVRVAKLLLDRKADPNARALNGFTPLHIACKKNRIKVVELLLKHGASIESTTESGLTPLHVASFMGCMNIVIFLLQHEANPDVPTVRGETPLHLAARANQTDIIRILLRNGAKVDARAREEQTPLHIASRLGNVDIVMLLLQHGAAVDTTTKDMYTALHIAAKEGQEEVAAILIENHASVKATTKNGFTPLHIAAKYGNMNVAKILLLKESKLDAQGKNDITPLHLACHYDHPNVANIILEKGASPHLPSQNGHTPLHIAARKNQMDIASTLLEQGADPNAKSKAGFTPLQLSAQKGHYDMTNLLIEHGADPNHKAKNGLTALHLCAQEDSIRVASILVKNGANVESETESGYRPIHVASHFGNLSMIRFLLKHNAQIDVCTNHNYTPLHQAAQQGHAHVVTALLEGNASHNAKTTDGLTPLNVAQKLGYISVMEVLKGLPQATQTPDNKMWEEKYKVIAPETLQETCFMSDSDDEGGSDGLINEQPYRYLTADLMKSLRDDSLPIDVTRDDPIQRQVSKEEKQEFTQSSNYCPPENFDSTDGISLGFLVSFLVDARGGTMKGCRHSGIRIIVPPRRATMPIRVTCRLMKPSKVANPPSLMEGEALGTRIIEMGPVGTSFLGPVLIDVPHFAAIQGKDREIIILRSENGETWKEHDNSHENDDSLFSTAHDTQMNASHLGRITRIITTEFPQYFAIVTRIKQEVHVIGADGGILISSVANHVQAVFPPGALTKKIKVGLQAHVIPAELTAKLLGNCVAVSPVITIEPRRRKFHKPITLTIPTPQAANKGMINQYGGETPTLRLLCSIAGGTSEAQWEDVTGSTPLTFLNDRVSFTTTVSARFWLMDCRNIGEVPKMATELYKESLFVPFITNFVIYTKRFDLLEATLRILCMTDGKEVMHTLEKQEEFLEIVKSRDVEALDGKDLYLEFSGNLVPVTKSGQQLKFTFKAFRQNRLTFHVKVKDPLLDPVARMMFMRDLKVAKGDPPQQPICVLNIVLPEASIPKSDSSLKIKELDSNFISKLDMYQTTYMRDYGEKRDIPKPTSPNEQKRITDILHKKETDAETIHESFAQKVACPIESVDASYPNNIINDGEISPNLEKQTYSEKRKFWEDITKQRESYQRSESEVSRTSQLTINESDSDYLQNVVSEDDFDTMPERSETMEDLNIPDMSECSVAEKAHYFEEQIQKELANTSRPVSKLISQDSFVERRKSIVEEHIDTKDAKQDRNVLEFERGEKSDAKKIDVAEQPKVDGEVVKPIIENVPVSKNNYGKVCNEFILNETRFIGEELQQTVDGIAPVAEKKPEAVEVSEPKPSMIPRKIKPVVASKSETTMKVDTQKEMSPVMDTEYVENVEKAICKSSTVNEPIREISHQMDTDEVNKDFEVKKIDVEPGMLPTSIETRAPSKIPMKIKTDVSSHIEPKTDIVETKVDISPMKRESSNLSEKELNRRESKIPVLSAKIDIDKSMKVKDEIVELPTKDVEIIPDDKKKKSGIPKRVIETTVTKTTGDNSTHEEIIETTKMKITEKVSQLYEEHTTETKTQSQTYSKTFTDAKEAMKAFEDMEMMMTPDTSVTTSKVDHVKSTMLEKKEIISSEISRGDEKTLKHEEKERQLREKSTESTVTTEKPDETLEDKKSKVEKSDKSLIEEIAVNLSGGKQIIDASASQAMKMMKDEQRIQSVEDDDGIVVEEAGKKTLKEHEIDMAINIEKDESQSMEEKEIDVSELRVNLEDDLKAAVIREEIHVESSSHSDMKVFPSRETSDDISRDEAFGDEVSEEQLETLQSSIADQFEVRNIAETIVQSIEDEIVNRSESTGALNLGFDFEGHHDDSESAKFVEEISENLTGKFEKIVEQARPMIFSHDERLDKDSTRGSLSMSEDFTKDEDSTPHDREESFASSSSQAKIIDRDFTMSPSSMSDQIELEEIFEMEKQHIDGRKPLVEFPTEIKVGEEYIEEPGEVAVSLKYEACENSGARVLEILEPVHSYHIRQDSVDAAPLEMDEPALSEDRDLSVDVRYTKDSDFVKLHESPAVHSLDKICDSPGSGSESSLVHERTQSLTKMTDLIKNEECIESDDAGFSSMEHERLDTAETITKLDTQNIDIDLMPPIVSPRTKLRELEIDHSKWMIGDDKIVVSEALQPSQEFDKELDEYQSNVVKQQSLTSSHDGSGDLESVTRSSEDVSALDSVKEISTFGTSMKPTKFTVELVSENDIEQEISLVEDKLDVSCQELVDTLQREYEAKTPTDERIPLTPRRTSESDGDSIVEDISRKPFTSTDDIPTEKTIVKSNDEVPIHMSTIETNIIKSNEKVETCDAEEKDVDTQEVLQSKEKKERKEEMKMEVALKGLKESFATKSKSQDDPKRHPEKSADSRDKLGHAVSVDSSSFKLNKDDLPNVDLSARYAITVLDQVVKKEIAEVKESLEAAKQDLIEELSENSETVFQIKDSPSEFQFKLQPETIPNDLPVLYKPPSLEQIVDQDIQSRAPVAEPRTQEDESVTETISNEKNVADEYTTEKVTVAVPQDTDEPSVPIPASRLSSDVDNKEEGGSSLSVPPQPVPRKRQKPARVSKKLHSESEGGSSSGESSNYHSCDYEIGSGSRPSSSDIEALQSASGVLSGTASEYETALMSIEQSSISKRTSQEYHSAVSTLSSRESMKSLNSLSSGHLGSIDSTGELTETLVASESEEMDKEEIDENLELDEDEAKASEDSSDSDMPLDESFDNVTGDIPSKMKRSSEMIFQQISDDAESSLNPEALEGSAEDQSTKVTSSILISEDDDVKTSTIDPTSDQISGKIEGSSSSPEVRLKYIEAQSTGDDIDSSELRMGSMSLLDEAEALLLSKRSVLQQASMSTSSTSGMSIETVIEREKIDRHSPDSDSFELVDKPDIIDDFVVIEEVGREAEEFDAEGKSISIKPISHIEMKKFDRDLENLITDTKDDAQVSTSQPSKNNELFDFESEESPPQASNEDQYSQSYSDEEQDAKKWMEMQFQTDPRAYELEYDRGPLEDIKEEEITDFEAGSSRFGSLGSHKGSIGSSGSMKGSYGSAAEYDVLAGRRIFSKSIEHDNISMNSLQEFESLENVVANENARRLQQCGSQDSVNNGSLPRRYVTSRSGHGDDISVSSLKDFEGLENACKEAHMIELRAKEEEDLLEHESPENRYRLENLPKPKPTESSTAGSFNPSTSGSDDYEKRIMEIDEIIRIAQANVEKFDRQDDTTEDISQIEITDVEKVEPITVTAVLPENEDVLRTREITNIMETSTDSLEFEDNGDKRNNPMCRSSDSLEMKTTVDFPSLSYSDSLNNVRETQDAQSMDPFNSSRRISSDSLEMPVLEPTSHIDDRSGVDSISHQARSGDMSVEVKITKNGKTTFSKNTADM